MEGNTYVRGEDKLGSVPTYGSRVGNLKVCGPEGTRVALVYPSAKHEALHSVIHDAVFLRKSFVISLCQLRVQFNCSSSVPMDRTMHVHTCILSPKFLII
jgi:hypothetical protein